MESSKISWTVKSQRHKNKCRIDIFHIKFMYFCLELSADHMHFFNISLAIRMLMFFQGLPMQCCTINSTSPVLALLNWNYQLHSGWLPEFSRHQIPIAINCPVISPHHQENSMPFVMALRASWCPGGAAHGVSQEKENFRKAAAAEHKAGALPRRRPLTFKKQILTQLCLWAFLFTFPRHPSCTAEHVWILEENYLWPQLAPWIRGILVLLSVGNLALPPSKGAEATGCGGQKWLLRVSTGIWAPHPDTGLAEDCAFGWSHLWWETALIWTLNTLLAASAGQNIWWPLRNLQKRCSSYVGEKGDEIVENFPALPVFQNSVPCQSLRVNSTNTKQL